MWGRETKRFLRKRLTDIRNQRTLSIRVTGVSGTTNACGQMIHHLTLRVLWTRSRAWVNTFISNARSTWGTISVQRTFRSTTIVWISEIVGQTLAWTSAVLHSANRVGATGAWIAWINIIELGRFFLLTLTEWIATISVITFADRGMANNMAFCVQTTHIIRTGISTMPIDACQIIGALWIWYTFGSAIWWISNEIRQTNTRVTISIQTALCIFATWRTQTWININWFIVRLRWLFNFWTLRNIFSIRFYNDLR